MSAPSEASQIAELDPIEWHHRPDDQNRLATTHAWSNHPAFDLSQPHPESLLVFPGLGEREGTINDLLNYLAKLGVPAVAPLFNIEQIRASKNDVSTFINDFGPNVTDALQTRGHIPKQARATGHSMGGGVLGAAVGEAPELFGDIGLEEPAGHSNAALRHKYPNDTLRELIFLKRFGQVLGYPFYEAPMSKKLMAGKELGYQMLRDTFVTLPPARRFWNKFHVASSVDPVPGVLEHAANGNHVLYVLGGKDPLIRPKEILASLAIGLDGLSEDDKEAAKANLTMVVTDNRHSHKAFAEGQEHTEIVVDHIYPDEHRYDRAA